MKIHYFFYILIFLLLSCNKANRNNPIPNLPFDITINLELPSYNALQGVGGSAFVEGGNQGIVVYRKSIEEFVAFDRRSPAKTDACLKPLTIDENNSLQLVDSCTQAKFSLYDGSILSGSEFGLRQYQTQFNGASILRIYN